MILSVVFNISFLVRWRKILKNLWKLEIKPLFGKKTFPVQRSKFAWAVGKCRGISPFYSICLGNKNAEAVKFWEKKKVFLELKKKFLVKEKNISFKKKPFFTRHKLFMCIYVHYSYLHFVYSYLHYSSALNRSSFPETLLCYALNEVIDVIHFFFLNRSSYY